MHSDLSLKQGGLNGFQIVIETRARPTAEVHTYDKSVCDQIYLQRFITHAIHLKPSHTYT